jgi:hypothetical protein
MLFGPRVHADRLEISLSLVRIAVAILVLHLGAPLRDARLHRPHRHHRAWRGAAANWIECDGVGVFALAEARLEQAGH